MPPRRRTNKEPRSSAQEAVYCDLCETAFVQMHCDTCNGNFCTACVGEHVASDEIFDHRVVKFRSMNSNPLYPDCASHDNELCATYCNQCEIPICLSCITMDLHPGHKLSKILEVLEKKKSQVSKDKSELKQTIYPTYQHIASDIQDIIAQLENGYEDLTTAITEHGEDLHKEINKLIKGRKKKAKKMKAKQMQSLQKKLDEVNEKLSNIKDEIHLFDNVLDSNDISKLKSFEGNLEKYSKIPDKILPFLPKFTPRKVFEDTLCELFGNLSSFSYSSDESGYWFKTEEDFPVAEFSPQVVKLLDEPKIVATIKTDYILLKNVACLSGDSFWTCGNGNIMKLYSIEQDLKLKSIKTLSGCTTASITVTPNGDFVFADYEDESVNIVKNKKIEAVIRLQGWRPRGVCGTSSGDLLVTMVSEDKEQSKVMRYSGSTEKQSIQYDVDGQPLYQCAVYITVNRNQDICVTDHRGRAIVVVNKAGKLRFRYKGESHIGRNEQFYPQGITTDSQSHILIANTGYGSSSKNCIHIIDQDGQFISYIDCGLNSPWGICTDTDDNLFVAEYSGKKVKKVKYQQCTNDIETMV
ncbi:E3 ubiquitin-protein ligase TRIM71-like [Magallana gigas]|uniref:E3 ubiquitin-protein ligase TRIM71-like n=1 Tax=Magallana gigas TaxID=29159 RepID=UPI00333F8088